MPDRINFGWGVADGVVVAVGPSVIVALGSGVEVSVGIGEAVLVGGTCVGDVVAGDAQATIIAPATNSTIIFVIRYCGFGFIIQPDSLARVKPPDNSTLDDYCTFPILSQAKYNLHYLSPYQFTPTRVGKTVPILFKDASSCAAKKV
jgi:hypothetical protein